jgi:type II secretory pathway pseudopilin PulG
MKRRIAFTLVELLAVIGIIALLVTIAVPSFNGILNIAKRAPCMANLKAIGGGMRQWQMETDGKSLFPMTGAGSSSNVQAGVWYGPDGNNMENSEADADAALFDRDGSKALSISASFFLLVREDYVGTNAFVCPADEEAEAFELPQGVSVREITDFGNAFNISYSMSYPWNDRTKNNVTYPKKSADFVVLSDISPAGGTPLYANSNSPNHKGKGQCVLYGDMAKADWVDRPTVGIGGDNIFTVQPENADEVDAATGAPVSDTFPTASGVGGTGGAPANAGDSVMVYYARNSMDAAAQEAETTTP